MTPLEQLQSYLRHLQVRLRLLAGARGAAVVFRLGACIDSAADLDRESCYSLPNILLPGLRILLFLAVALDDIVLADRLASASPQPSAV